MEIKIIREELIKSEIPTPPVLQSYKLSMLDQLNQHVQVPIVYFYPSSDQSTRSHIPSKLALLRKSLSKTLVHFYPFAGKLSGDGLFVDCSNDNGAHYVEAEVVDYTIHQILSPPDMNLVRQLIPHQDVFAPPSYVLMVRVNVFKCGGIAVTFACSHRIVDGSAMLLFMEAWAATACGLPEPPVPSFPAPSLFPQDPLLPKDSNLCPWEALSKNEKCVTRRFVFDSLALRNLRTRASSSTFVERPSRFDSVVALVWGCAMAASRQRRGSKRRSVFSYAFDLRRVMGPSLSDKAFGNLILQIPVVCNAEDSVELQRLVGLLKEAKLKINEHTRKIWDNMPYQELCGTFSNQNADSTDFFFCSSLLNRGVNEADLGWGKPKWICPGALDCRQLKNLIFMAETISGDGIEVWLTMEEKDMALLERNPELLQFASVNPYLAFEHKYPLSSPNLVKSAL